MCSRGGHRPADDKAKLSKTSWKIGRLSKVDNPSPTPPRQHPEGEHSFTGDPDIVFRRSDIPSPAPPDKRQRLEGRHSFTRPPDKRQRPEGRQDIPSPDILLCTHRDRRPSALEEALAALHSPQEKDARAAPAEPTRARTSAPSRIPGHSEPSRPRQKSSLRLSALERLTLVDDAPTTTPYEHDNDDLDSHEELRRPFVCVALVARSSRPLQHSGTLDACHQESEKREETATEYRRWPVHYKTTIKAFSDGQPSRTRERPSRPPTSSRTRVLLVVVKKLCKAWQDHTRILKLGTAVGSSRSVRPPIARCSRSVRPSLRRRSRPRRQSTTPSAPSSPILARVTAPSAPPSLRAPVAVARCARPSPVAVAPPVAVARCARPSPVAVAPLGALARRRRSVRPPLVRTVCQTLRPHPPILVCENSARLGIIAREYRQRLPDNQLEIVRYAPRTIATTAPVPPRTERTTTLERCLRTINRQSAPRTIPPLLRPSTRAVSAPSPILTRCPPVARCAAAPPTVDPRRQRPRRQSSPASLGAPARRRRSARRHRSARRRRSVRPPVAVAPRRQRPRPPFRCARRSSDRRTRRPHPRATPRGCLDADVTAITPKGPPTGTTFAPLTPRTKNRQDRMTSL